MEERLQAQLKVSLLINKMNDAFETFVLYIQSAVHAKLTC